MAGAVYQEERENVVFHALPHLSTREVGSVLERAVRRIERFLKKRGLLRDGENDADREDDAPALAPTVLSNRTLGVDSSS